MADVEGRVASNDLAWGKPNEVAERLIEAAEAAGTNSLLLQMNLGALPHEMFLEQIRRFGKEVLPKLQAHQVKQVRYLQDDAKRVPAE
jgi:hypothetical protein